jgi:pyruvate formate lyase activating enzyme
VVEIKGLEKFASKDFPGYISSTVFLGGCNFRCPYCQNPDLVLRPGALPSILWADFMSYLDERKNWLEGICVSGGEPLLEKNLLELLRAIKDRNFLVKLDTNGSFPGRLEELVREKLVDSIAMDVKAPLEKYQEVTNSEVDEEDIARSIEIIKNSGLEYMFRTTVVPGLVDAEDIKEIGQLLAKAEIFQIQQFSPTNTLDTSYLQKKPYSREEIQKMAGIAKPYFSEVRIEGV